MVPVGLMRRAGAGQQRLGEQRVLDHRTQPGSSRIFPFSTTAALDAKIATAVVSLAIGIATGTLVGGVRRDPSRERGSRKPID